MKRAICVSGGGSKGAYAVGILEYYKDIGRNYDIYLGSSTGSLISTLAASGNYDSLINGYTNINHKDIFKISPFKIKKGKNGVYKYSISLMNSMYNLLIRRKVSFGDNTTFRNKTIPRFFSQEDYNNIIINGKELGIAVSNLTLEHGEIKYLKEYSYEMFCDWMWASTCVPLFTTVPLINGEEYVDGGLLNMVPIEEAILNDADEIDVIILDKEFPTLSNIEYVRNMGHFIDKLLNMMLNRIKKSNINLGALTHIAKKDVIINFHYTERKLTNNSLIFDKDLMQMWRKEGYEKAKSGFTKRYLLMGEKNTYKLIE